MNKFKFKIVKGRKVFEIPEKICEEMFKIKEKILPNTFPKPNKFTCAVLTINGNIYPGISYNTEIYTATMHGEMVALAHAAVHGEKEIIAITGPSCHLCKQVIWENSLQSGIEILMIIKNDNGFKKIPISELMPLAWPDINGNK